MFNPFWKGNEISSTDPHQEDNNQDRDHVILLHQHQAPVFERNIVENDHTHNTSNTTNDDDQRKIVRKEIERQRRQQMSTLHASLRSLLPLESLKGKRSVSDHINEAVNYIECLKNNIKELSVKRDRLKRLSNSSSTLEAGKESSGNHLVNNVSVRSQAGGGLQIVVSSDYGDEGFLLSKVLEAVIEEGFEVVSCISTKKDGRLYNTIQCQASDSTCIDLAGLQQKLNDVIFSSRII